LKVFKHKIVIYLGFLMLLSNVGCIGPKQLYYMQNLQDTTITYSKNERPAKIRIGDQLYIFVSSPNMEAAGVYNAPNFSAASSNLQQGSTQDNPVAGYLVDENGAITLPKIGLLHVVGLSHNQLKDSIVQKINGYLKDPIVNIRLINFRVSILGEVKNPGTFTIPNADLTILQALGYAGDLTINGIRESVLLIRQNDKSKVTYRINLTDKNLIQHPAYMLQSGDVIYVEPNKVKINTSSTFFQIWPATVSAVSVLFLVLNNLKK